MLTQDRAPLLSDESWDKVCEDGYKSIEKNVKVRMARDFALGGENGLVKEQLELKYKGINFESLSDDPDFLELVDRFSLDESVQEEALRRQADRAIQAAIDRIERNMSDPSTSSGVVSDGASLLLKLSNQLEKRTGAQSIERSIVCLLGIVQINTPEGEWTIRIESSDDVLQVITLLRCGSKLEVDSVIQFIRESAPNFLNGMLELKGW